MADFYMKTGDLLPKIRATLSDENGAIDLTGATVKIWWRLESGGDGDEASGVCTLVDATGGVVEYAWAAGDTDEAGLYLVEFEVSIGGKSMTVPSNTRLTMEISEDLDSTD